MSASIGLGQRTGDFDCELDDNDSDSTSACSGALVVRDDHTKGRRYSATSGSNVSQIGGPALPGNPASCLGSLAGITVLYVDDEGVNRQVARRMLQKLGCTAHVLSVRWWLPVM